jgi:peptide deformylase
VAARDVLRYPHPALKQRCREVTAEDDVDRIVRDLVDTMQSFPRCVGVAAPQIGELVRIAVVDVSSHPKADRGHGLLVLVNPRVVRAEGRELGREGCLSVPELTANVRRATLVTVEADGVRVEAAGFEARAIQHELDHLDGVLFLDRVASRDDVFRRRSHGR